MDRIENVMRNLTTTSDQNDCSKLIDIVLKELKQNKIKKDI